MPSLSSQLQSAGWNDAGRDCWVKHQGTEPSLVLRWAQEVTLEDARRLMEELNDLKRALLATFK